MSALRFTEPLPIATALHFAWQRNVNVEYPSAHGTVVVEPSCHIYVRPYVSLVKSCAGSYCAG